MTSKFLSIYFEGKALCMLTEEMFKQRVPNSGDILYRALKNLLPYELEQLREWLLQFTKEKPELRQCLIYIN